jgi:hypothetical protein
VAESSDVVWLLVSLVAGVAFVWFIVIWARADDRLRARLLARQTAHSSGKVLGLRETKQSLGERPVMIIRIGFAPSAGAQLLERELETTVSPFDAHRVQPGVEFPVRFEPADPENFSMDFGGVTGVVLRRRWAPAEY